MRCMFKNLSKGSNLQGAAKLTYEYGIQVIKDDMIMFARKTERGGNVCRMPPKWRIGIRSMGDSCSRHGLCTATILTL